MTPCVEVAFNLPVNKKFLYAFRNEISDPVGCRIKASFGKRTLTGYVLSLLPDNPEPTLTLKPVDRFLDPEPVIDKDLIELAEWMSRLYLCSMGEALSVCVPGGIRETVSDLADIDEGTERLVISLSENQTRAVETIMTGEEGWFYVYGVTGSGKTEVFLSCAEKVLTEGKSVIYLVPEIALTHQVLTAIQARFGNKAAVIHSGLTPSQKLAEWRRIRRGEATVVVGARSAVFAPIKQLGLIIIDEEHESTYKAGAVPRYHARQIAMKRCTVHKAKLVMGSATPSLEAWHLIREGKLISVTLPERHSGGRMPELSVVDMTKEKGSLSVKLLEEMKAAYREGRQTILFLNRRGFSYFFHCRSCGFEMKCRQCSITLTYHKQKNRMICHYCGFNTEPASVCPSCNSLDIGYAGFGTEKIEEELRSHFPFMTIERVDADATRKKDSLKRRLEEFRDGRIHVLVGTQMVAKGLNFPGVKLVGIILADTTLSLPDFRSAERTFSLLVQVSGRAGRFLPDGRVIIQTFRPGHPAIRFAGRHDLPGFFDQELAMRKSLSFPPYTRLFRILFRSKNMGKSESAAFAFTERLFKSKFPAGEILGPAECPIQTIAGNHRYHIILRSMDFSRSHFLLKSVVDAFVLPAGVYMELDIDPRSLL